MDQLTAFFQRPTVNWWDVVDILVVSILIYESLKLIRGTRAAQMALGRRRPRVVSVVATVPLHTVTADSHGLCMPVWGHRAVPSDIAGFVALVRVPFFRAFAERRSRRTIEKCGPRWAPGPGQVGALIVLK